VLAGWVALLSPTWCCCANVWGGQAGSDLAQSVPVQTGQSQCSGCTSAKEGHPTENQSSHPGDTCDCGLHQRIDTAVIGQSTFHVAPPQVQPVVVSLPYVISTFAFEPLSVIANIRGAPPHGDLQSLLARYCLLLV